MSCGVTNMELIFSIDNFHLIHLIFVIFFLHLSFTYSSYGERWMPWYCCIPSMPLLLQQQSAVSPVPPTHRPHADTTLIGYLLSVTVYLDRDIEIDKGYSTMYQKIFSFQLKIYWFIPSEFIVCVGRYVGEWYWMNFKNYYLSKMS